MYVSEIHKIKDTQKFKEQMYTKNMSNMNNLNVRIKLILCLNFPIFIILVLKSLFDLATHNIYIRHILTYAYSHIQKYERDSIYIVPHINTFGMKK